MTDDTAWGHDGPPSDITDYQLHHVPLNRQPKKRKGSTPESKVLKACIDYLEDIGCYVSRTGAGLLNVEGRTISMGRTGQFDITACVPNGCYLAVDAKSAKGKPSAAQLEQQRLIEERGGTALFARSVDDLRAQLCAAYGPQRVAQWEAEGQARRQAKKDTIDVLKRKKGQIK